MAGYATYQRESETLRFSIYRHVLKNLTPEQRQLLRHDPDGHALLSARVTQRVAQVSLKKQNAYGKVVLDSIWRIFINGWHQLYLGEYDTLLEWAENTLLIDEDGEPLINEKHLQALIRTVERIFRPVYAAQQEGNPYITPDGEVITPELLIGEPGTQEKMRLVSLDFDQAATHEERQEILTSVFTESKNELEARKSTERAVNGLLTWKRVLLDEDTYEYIVTVPRKYSPAVESALNGLGAQQFE
jgi:hypothetical protein